MKYLSQEWVDALKEKSNSDAEYLKKAKGMTFKAQLLVTDCPGGVDKLIDVDLKDGKVVSIKLQEKPAPSELRTTPFDAKQCFLRATSSYEMFTKLNKGEIAPIQALSSGDYKLDGDMAKIMEKMGLVVAFNEFMASVAPVEY
jgi:putative sterol carrier protein